MGGSPKFPGRRAPLSGGRNVGDRAHAEDLLQTALVKTYLGWSRIRDHAALEAYVRVGVRR